jgi:diguanylate cyclase (GGDEF)-like protein
VHLRGSDPPALAGYNGTLRHAVDPRPVVDVAFVEREVGDLPMCPRLAEVHRRLRARRGAMLEADMLRAIAPLENLEDDEACALWRRITIHRARMRSHLGRQVPFIVAALDCLVVEGALSRPVIAAEARLRSVVRGSTHDALTGVLNRGAFDQLLARELERARRYEYSMALLLMDLDRFKPFNDRHGHPAGDTLLRRFGAILRSEMRASDWCARYGGDEFAVIAAHTDEPGALHLALRLVTRAECELGGEVTLSAGIAADDGHDSAEELVAAADAALYATKRRGGASAVRASTLEPAWLATPS